MGDIGSVHVCQCGGNFFVMVMMVVVVAMLMIVIVFVIVAMKMGVIIVVMIVVVVMIMVIMVVMQQSGLQIRIQIGLLHQLPYLLLQQRQLGRIEHFHLIVLVHQLSQLGQRAIGVGGGHRRRQVIDDDGMGAALGLRTLARVIDDEGIKQRHIRQQRIRKTVSRQAHALAWQPFERAVLADMNDGVSAPLIP